MSSSGGLFHRDFNMCWRPLVCRSCVSTCPAWRSSAVWKASRRTLRWWSSWTTCTTSALWGRSSMGCSTASTSAGELIHRQTHTYRHYTGPTLSHSQCLSYSLHLCSVYLILCCSHTVLCNFLFIFSSMFIPFPLSIEALAFMSTHAHSQVSILNHLRLLLLLSPQSLHHWHHEPGYFLLPQPAASPQLQVKHCSFGKTHSISIHLRNFTTW